MRKRADVKDSQRELKRCLKTPNMPVRNIK
jgi:hypothetical protein